MRVHINGEVREIDRGKTLDALLSDLEIKPGTVVVEHNGNIVRGDECASEFIEPDAEIEIVRFVGGG